MNELVILHFVCVCVHFQMPIVIVGGVTATGKTSVAKELSALLHWDYIEADDFHSKANIAKMQAGNPLTDDDRLPWLQILHEQLANYSSTHRSCVMTCSALKRRYRQILLTGACDSDAKVETPAATECFLFMLTVSRDELHQRLLKRQHEHFMNPSLLDSQLDTLELPANESDEPCCRIIQCDGLSQEDVLHRIRSVLHL